jgi:hypothetical protein
VIHVSANLLQLVAHHPKAKRAKFAVPRQIQDPDHTVFHKRTGGYFQLILLKRKPALSNGERVSRPAEQSTH